jgi:predicted signal transduction protein with EAL and GGDEF domain
LLAQIGPRLAPTLGRGDVLARLGGDEFALLLPATALQRAEEVAAELQRRLAAPFIVDTVRLHVRASIGIATAPVPATSRAELLRCADVAMYQAKSGGTGMAVYVPDPGAGTWERLRTMEELHTALADGQLVVHLQPQLDPATNRVVGAEALVRWAHPTRGLLLPGAFLPAAEQAGLQRPLADAVIDLSLAAAARWHRAEARIPVSVNLSAANVTDLDLPNKIAAALERHGLPPGALTVEVTEDTLMTDPERARDVLLQLRRAGVGVSIDDYGTGYSSLAYLRHLPADELKLDRTFTTDLETDPHATAIVRHTVELAHSLGLRLVAEGIETAQVAAALAALGCDVGQGYWIARPMPVEDMVAWLAAAHGAKRSAAA